MGEKESKKEIAAMVVAKKALDTMRQAENLAMIRPTEWYLSAQGKAAYREAQDPMQKLLYFYAYLRAVCYKRIRRAGSYGWEEKTRSESTNEFLYKIAFIMAKVGQGSSLPYANYPDILDPEKNPLVRFCENSFLEERLMLYTLCGVECDEEEKFTFKERAFQHLTYCDGECTDQYKLERYFIWALMSKKPLEAVYCYDIINSPQALDSDEEDELEEEEVDE